VAQSDSEPTRGEVMNQPYKNMSAVNIDIVTALRAIGNNVGTGVEIRNIILHAANHIEELRGTIRELGTPADGGDEHG
jgi:hypothetical protein